MAFRQSLVMNYHLVLCRNATLNKVKSVVRGRRGIAFI